MAKKSFTNLSVKASLYPSVFGIYIIMFIIGTKFLSDWNDNNIEKSWWISLNKW